GREENNKRSRRRLLERLQDRVGRFESEPLGFVDDEDAATAFVRTKLSLFRHQPHLIDSDKLALRLFLEIRVFYFTQNGSNVGVLVALDSQAGNTHATSVSINGVRAIE